MKTSRLIAGLSIALCLGSALAQASPQHGRQDQGSRGQPHQAQQSGHAGKAQAAPRREQAAPSRHNSHSVQRSHPQHRPPADIRSVHRSIHGQRHHIGRGPALPRHVHIVKGKRMPHGWGKRLSHRQLRYVPHYHGYEWRRTGSDMILIAVTSGIVVEILRGVLD